MSTVGQDLSFLLSAATRLHSAAWLEHERALAVRPQLDAGRRCLRASAGPRELPRAATSGAHRCVLVRGHDGCCARSTTCAATAGMTLVTGCGHSSATSHCPYHGWRFALDGAVTDRATAQRAVPRISSSTPVGPAARRGGEWEGMVFANPDPDATPLVASAWATCPTTSAATGRSCSAQVAHVGIEGDCNWKLFVENHIDVLPPLVPARARRSGDFDHTAVRAPAARPQLGQLRTVAGADARRRRSTRGTVPIAHIDDRDRFGIGAHMMFPNMLMASTVEFFITLRGARRSRPTARSSTCACGPSPDADADALVAAARIVHRRGHRRVRAGPRRRWRSRRFAVGPLAREHEAPITRFHEHLLTVLDAVAPA